MQQPIAMKIRMQVCQYLLTMSTRSLDLKLVLLSMLAHGTCDHETSAGLIPIEWESLLGMVRQHRLGPLLHWRLAQNRECRNVPESFAHALATSHRRHLVRSLELRAELLLTHRLLRQNAIAGIFLKGAFLAHYAYPEPALRPLRDLDVLIPREQALDAFDALLRAGFTRIGLCPGNPEAAAAHRKHLPPLLTPSGRVAIELHTRLITPESGAASPRREPADDPEIRERLIHREIAGEQIAYLSPTDQLLHLIVHSVCDHGFNNGPLVLTDIAHLLWKTEIDWPAFWRMAAAGDWLRGSWLLLHMTQHYYALQFPPPPTSDLPRLPPDLTSMLADLMLSNPIRSADARLHADLYQERRLFRRARVVVQRLCPSSGALVATNHTPDQPLGLTTAYLKHWWRLTTIRFPEYLASRRTARLDSEESSLLRLRHWLAD